MKIPCTREELPQVIEECEQQLKKSPDNIYLLVNLASCYRTLAESEATVTEPDFVGKKPTVSWQEDHLKKARLFCLHALELEPDFIYARALLGHLYLHSGNYSAAVSEYQHVIASKIIDWITHRAIYVPIVAECRNNLAYAYLRMAQAETISVFKDLKLINVEKDNYPFESVIDENFSRLNLFLDPKSPLTHFVVVDNLYAFDLDGNITYPAELNEPTDEQLTKMLMKDLADQVGKTIQTIEIIERKRGTSKQQIVKAQERLYRELTGQDVVIKK